MSKIFKILAGPCVIESEEMIYETAEVLTEILKGYEVDFYFKASFDKANRTSVTAYRGPGIKKGMEILSMVKKKFKVKVVTDIHEPYQAQIVAPVADIIQIPAFLCRQTDLLTAAAKTGKTINVKKAQFLAPWDMVHVVNKIREAGNNQILVTERGTTFGYNTLVVDMTGLVELRRLGCPVIFDATHSVQKPGGKGDKAGGKSEYVKYLARAAAAVGVDGIFAEVHPDPDNALSDGPNMIMLKDFKNTFDEIIKVNNLVKCFEEKENEYIGRG